MKEKNKKPLRVGIIGATGYAGAELVRILSGHPGVALSVLTSRNHVGKEFQDIYPAMAGAVHLVCEAFEPGITADKADVFFTALPHKLPMELVPGLIENKKKVIDLSADFRFRDVSKYEAFYQPHTARESLEQSVYGLTEIYKQEISNSSLIGNPGCYPTSVLLPLVPLLRETLIDPHFLVADSKSGVSGAGRAPSLTTLFCEVSESFKAYKVAEHRHNPEMDEVLGRAAGQEIHMTFTPHLVPMSRGMFSTMYTRPLDRVKVEDVYACLMEAYSGSPFVRILPEGRLPDTLHVRGTNFCDIGLKMHNRTGHLILMSVIDNLGKGAAGQAVQNMNVMLGFDEVMGLESTPFPL